MLSFCKTHGGKGNKRILKWILSQFPTNYKQLSYLEPYVGGGSVILNKDASAFEAINDLDLNTYCLYQCARSRSLLRVKQLHYSKNIFEFYKTHTPANNPAIAEKEYILRNMSRGGMKKDFAWSERLRGGQPGDINAWANKLKKLPDICDRLRYVDIHNEDAITFMRRFNKSNVFAYLDPPYLPETRTSKKIYNHEMTVQQHKELLEFLANDWKGLFVLSGYESKLYNDFLGKLGYNTAKLSVSNNSGQTKVKSKREEICWRNY